jgi:hypothetical protein
MTSDERTNEIADRIYETVKEDDVQSTLQAMVQIFIFEMSLICPACRERIAKRLVEIVPAMLTEASEIAASASAEVESTPECYPHYH